MSNTNPTKVITGPVRLSYANVWEPKSNMGGKEKYSAVLLIPKTDVATIKIINGAIEAVKQIGKVERWNGKIPTNISSPLHDGDEKVNGDDHAEYAGMYFLNTYSTDRPSIVDRNVKPILDQDEVYSGCWARVSVNLYPYNFKGKMGIGVGLNHIQKIKDDNRFGKNSSADQDFSIFGGEELLD